MHYEESLDESMSIIGDGLKQSGPLPVQSKSSKYGKVSEGAVPSE